jgi:hypothetical protein
VNQVDQQECTTCTSQGETREIAEPSSPLWQRHTSAANVSPYRSSSDLFMHDAVCRPTSSSDMGNSAVSHETAASDRPRLHEQTDSKQRSATSIEAV